MPMPRRQFTTATLAGAAGLGLGFPAVLRRAYAADPIKIGVPTILSGGNVQYGTQVKRACELFAKAEALPLGWKQRLALGCALIHEPPILFLDEPTSGVDPVSRRRCWDLIDLLAERGTTVLVSTHYMEEAEFCHRLALMKRGLLIALDRPAALRRGLDQPVLELLTDDAPRAVEALRGTPGVLEVGMFGRAVHVLAADAAVARARLPGILAAAVRRLYRLQSIEPSLEDVFAASTTWP